MQASKYLKTTLILLLVISFLDSTEGKKKAKKGSNPLFDAEADLITFISKTKEIYQMVFNARKSPNSVDFFTNLKL